MAATTETPDSKKIPKTPVTSETKAADAAAPATDSSTPSAADTTTPPVPPVPPAATQPPITPPTATPAALTLTGDAATVMELLSQLKEPHLEMNKHANATCHLYRALMRVIVSEAQPYVSLLIDSILKTFAANEEIDGYNTKTFNKSMLVISQQSMLSNEQINEWLHISSLFRELAAPATRAAKKALMKNNIEKFLCTKTRTVVFAKLNGYFNF